MKRFIITCCMLAIVCCFAYAEPFESQKKYKVSNAKEFIEALGNSRTIVLEPGAIINLSEVMRDLLDCNMLRLKEISIMNTDYSTFKNPQLSYEEVFDGFQLVICGLNKLTIEGDAVNPPSIVAEPRYSYVLSFVNCKNVTIKNVNIGHTEEGYCDGGVLRFVNCEKVNLVEDSLYGCGTEGINADNTKKLICDHCDIFECTYYIMTLFASEDITFKDCYFHDNREFDLVRSFNSLNVKFNQCVFTNNNGMLFHVDGDPIELNNCTINHDEEMLGDWLKLLDHNCKIN